MAIKERDIFWDWDAACIQGSQQSRQKLAKYVLEDIYEIAKICHDAQADLERLTGDASFHGYVARSPKERVRLEVQSLYEHLQGLTPQSGGELTYTLEPIESAQTEHKQRIRLAREVLFWGHGVCLDWTLLFAACLYHAHIYPLLILTRSHAFVGYWLDEASALQNERTVLSGKEVQQFFAEGLIQLVNVTRIPPDESGQPMRFEDAEMEPQSWISTMLFAVDILCARRKRIESLVPLEPWSDNHRLTRAEYFQPRPEFERISNWWQDEDSYGVLALLGIGGAGKSTLVRRFISRLPGSHVQDEKVTIDSTLRRPDALFIWSFYEEPDVDRCATALYNYLTGEQAAKAKFEQVQEVLSNYLAWLPRLARL